MGNSLLSSLRPYRDVVALKEELRERDVPITWEFANDELGMSFLFIRDPEGNLIQVCSGSSRGKACCIRHSRSAALAPSVQ